MEVDGSLMKDVSRIDIAVPFLALKDAVSEEARCFQKLLKKRGFESEIFAEDFENAAAHQCRPFKQYKKINYSKSVLIYEYSTGCQIPVAFLERSPFIITRYQNITPARYFTRSSELQVYYDTTRMGRQQRFVIRAITNATWGSTKYTLDDLDNARFPNKHVLPVLRDYQKLLVEAASSTSPDKVFLTFLNSDIKKIIFVGRIVPNKAIHDLFFFLKLYNSCFNQKVQLLLAGSLAFPSYNRDLFELATKLNLSMIQPHELEGKDQEKKNFDILLAGSVSDAELAALYKSADVFMCLSEHEGFCVPVIEAMTFGLPVMAHLESAVPETVGDGGILIDKSNPVAVIETLHGLFNDKKLINVAKNAAIKRAAEFSWANLEQKFYSCLASVLGTKKN